MKTSGHHSSLNFSVFVAPLLEPFCIVFLELLALSDDLLDNVSIALVLPLLNRCLLLLPVARDRTVDLVLVLTNPFLGCFLEPFQRSLKDLSFFEGSHQNEQVLHVVLELLIDSFRAHFISMC